jgi:hypothetical protein
MTSVDEQFHFDKAMIRQGRTCLLLPMQRIEIYIFSGRQIWTAQNNFANMILSLDKKFQCGINNLKRFQILFHLKQSLL